MYGFAPVGGRPAADRDELTLGRVTAAAVVEACVGVTVGAAPEVATLAKMVDGVVIDVAAVTVELEAILGAVKVVDVWSEGGGGMSTPLVSPGLSAAAVLDGSPSESVMLEGVGCKSREKTQAMPVWKEINCQRRS